MHTKESAITQWLRGVSNAATSFRPITYTINVAPTQRDIISALQTLSRLIRYGGFISDVEEAYAQQVRYAIEHIHNQEWSPAQCSAAKDAITASLDMYYHYDPSIGNGIEYQSKCFHKTLRDIDTAVSVADGHIYVEPDEVQVKVNAVPCCLTPYYKHTTLYSKNATESFKFPTHNHESFCEHPLDHSPQRRDDSISAMTTKTIFDTTTVAQDDAPAFVQTSFFSDDDD